MSLRLKILLPLVSFASLLIVYLYGYWMPHSLANIEEGSLRSLELHLDSVAEGLVPLLLGHQLDAIYENLDSLMKKNSDWISIRLTAVDGRLLYPLETAPPAAAEGRRGKDIHVVERRIEYFDTGLGSLILTVDFAPRLSGIRKRHGELMSVLLVLIVLLSTAAGIVVDRLVRRPVNLLARASQRLARGDFDVPLAKTGNDEVGILVDSFENMRSAIREYRSTLQNAHEQLQGELAERKLAEKGLAERAMLAELSADIGYALAQQGEPRRILQACSEALIRRLGAAFVRIWVFHAAENVLELQAGSGRYTRIDGCDSRVLVGKSEIGLIAEERKPYVTNAVLGDPRVQDQEWVKREGMTAFAGHPLTIEDKLVGVMAMFSRNPLTDVIHKALASVSNEIALGIERKLSEDALHRLNRELRAVSNCNQVLVRAEDERALLNDICRIVCDEAGYRMAWVGYAEHDDARTVRPAAWAGVEDGYLAAAGITWADTERGRGPTGIAIRTGKTDGIQDFATEAKAAPWRDSALQRGYRSSISLPLKDERDNTFGILCINSTEPNVFTPDEKRLLEELAGDLAYGITVLRARIERKRAEEALRELSEELEQRVKQRTVELEQKNAELEKMNRLFVGRELRMKELKERIQGLEKKANREDAKA